MQGKLRLELTQPCIHCEKMHHVPLEFDRWNNNESAQVLTAPDFACWKQIIATELINLEQTPKGVMLVKRLGKATIRYPHGILLVHKLTINKKSKSMFLNCLLT